MTYLVSHTYRPHGFTLIEALIALLITGILFGLIFRSYNTSASISLRVQNQQEVMEELLYIQQYMDTLSDGYYLNMERYIQSGNIDEQGVSDDLFLINTQGEKLHILSTGSCTNDYNGTCAIAVKKQGEYITLSDPNRVYMDNIRFEIRPSRPYSGSIYTTLAVQDIQAQGFRMYGEIRSAPYHTGIREYSIAVPFQTFFSLVSP